LSTPQASGQSVLSQEDLARIAAYRAEYGASDTA